MGHDLDEEEYEATLKLMEEHPHLRGGIDLEEIKKYEEGKLTQKYFDER